MKTLALIFFVMTIFVSMTAERVAAQTMRVKVNKFSISGTSSLHDWESEVTQAEWKGIINLEDEMVSGIRDVLVKVPVKSIKSDKGKIMDNKTYDAFNSDKYPSIQFKLTSAKISGTPSNISVNATGSLTMAGKTKTIDMQIDGKLSNGELQLKGSKKLNMKDFGMEPPTAMMGAIKVGEEVTVHFDITISITNTNTYSNN